MGLPSSNRSPSHWGVRKIISSLDAVWAMAALQTMMSIIARFKFFIGSNFGLVLRKRLSINPAK
jgi:hypothetical protein